MSNTNNDIKRAIQSFWLLGLLNNAPWVLMLACATNISSGGVALVFLANQAPGLLTKLSVPFWFHRVGYRKRMKLGSWALGLACFLVGWGGFWNDELAYSENENEAVEGDDLNSDDMNNTQAQYGLILELLGVSFTSFQCSLGEASLLALAGKFDSSILPKIQVSASSSSFSPDSYSAVENNGDISLTTDENDGNDGIFSSEEYNGNTSNNTSNEQQQSSPNTNSNDALMKTEQQSRKCITAFASGTGQSKNIRDHVAR